GTMGTGITQTAALAGLKAILLDVTDDMLRTAVQRLGKNLDRLVTAGKLDQSVRDAALASVQTTTDYAALSAADAVIEAATESHPGRFVGMHFFNPVPVMKLIEVIRGLQTTDDTHDRVIDLAEKLGKSPINAANRPGFVVNRILLPMINEAFFLLAEGDACADDIDQGMKLGCNHPIGPLALADLIGLDVLLSVMEVFHQDFADSKYRPCPLLREMV